MVFLASRWKMQKHVVVVMAFSVRSKIGRCLRVIVLLKGPKKWASLIHKGLFVALRVSFHGILRKQEARVGLLQGTWSQALVCLYLSARVIQVWKD